MLQENMVRDEARCASIEYYRDPQTLEQARAYIAALEAQIAMMNHHSHADAMALRVLF